jgi:hypothetical protein
MKRTAPGRLIEGSCSLYDPLKMKIVCSVLSLGSEARASLIFENDVFPSPLLDTTTACWGGNLAIGWVRVDRSNGHAAKDASRLCSGDADEADEADDERSHVVEEGKDVIAVSDL